MKERQRRSIDWRCSQARRSPRGAIRSSWPLLLPVLLVPVLLLLPPRAPKTLKALVLVVLVVLTGCLLALLVVLVLLLVEGAFESNGAFICFFPAWVWVWVCA